jgi:pilus assembly protein Flp/PilA
LGSVRYQCGLAKSGASKFAILDFSFLSPQPFGGRMVVGRTQSESAGMPAMLERFVADDAGATAIEYGLICALIALAILAALNTTGEALVASLQTLLAAFP